MDLNLKDNTMRVLQVSTGHIPRRTAVELGESPGSPANASLWDYLTYALWGEYGWILHTSKGQINTARALNHPELANLLQFALSQGFGYVWLDADAPQLPEQAGLKFHTW